MADPITDPLGTIMQAFLGYFDPVFLAFALITGYFVFFLFFYNAKEWGTLDWTERFFFGFIIGISSAFISMIIFLPAAFLLVTLHLENQLNNLLYALPLGFLVFLLLVRIVFRLPLCSLKIKNALIEFLQTNRAYWPILLPVCSSLIIFGFLLNNPMLTIGYPSIWISFLIFLNITVPAYTTAMIVFFSVLCSLSTGLDFTVLPRIGQWYFLSFLRRRKKVCFIGNDRDLIPKESLSVKLARVKQTIKGLIKITKKAKSTINYDFFRVLLILVLIIILFIGADRTFQIVSPSIQIIDTQSLEGSQIEFYRCWNNSIVYFDKITQTYWISLPMINLRNFNIPINNPSNFGTDEIESINSMHSRELSLKVLHNDSFSYDLANNAEGQLQYINIMPTDNSLTHKKVSNFTLSFYNLINLNSVEISEPSATVLANGSTIVSVYVNIKNDNSGPLHSYGVPLFPTGSFNNLGNITSFNWRVHGDQNYELNDYVLSDNWVVSPSISVYPNHTVSFIAQVMFEESG